MSYGVIAELDELIQLRRYASSAPYLPKARALHAGNYLSRRRGRGMDFAEVRNYQAGDEIRHMEWRITARTGKPHVKLYQEERERPVNIMVDFSSTMYFGTRIAFKSVTAARLAALVCWTALKQNDRVGGVFFSNQDHQEFVPSSREAGVLSMLSHLSAFTRHPIADYSLEPQKFITTLLRLRRVTKPGSILVLISDFYSLNEECETHLHALRNHNEVIAYHICDPLELEPPKPQQYAISNGLQESLLDTRVKEVSSSYGHYCQQRLQQLKDLFQRTGIFYIPVTANQDLPKIIHKTYLGRSYV